MMKKIYLVVAVALLVFACKKKTIEPLPESNDPVFYVNGTVGNSAINLIAGENGMIMKQGVESRNGVDYAFSLLSNGNTWIKMGIFDGDLAMPKNWQDLKVGDSIPFANKFNDNLANLSKNNFSNEANISSIDWYIDGLFKGTNQVTISEPGLYNVCGNFTFTNGVQKSICNTMYLGFEQDIDFSIKHFLSENGDVKLWIDGETQYYDSVVWHIGNETVSTSGTYSTNIGNVVQSVSATIYQQNGAVRRKNIVIDGTFSGNYIEDFEVCEIPTSQKKWDYSAGIEANIDGETLTSFDLSNYKSSVLVKNVELHEVNLQGEKVIRITVAVDAMMKSKSTGTSKPLNFEGVLAYPVPN
ncbi:MAG: hypothetical protein ACSHXL_06570 [Bacteroidota bacterium]